MSSSTSSVIAGDVPRLFDPLEPADFIRLEHAASLKGLLKPFKGKGQLESWASQCQTLRDGLITLAQRLSSQASAYPFNLLPVILAQQRTSTGTVFLRWRSTDRSAMGVALWAELIANGDTPLPLVRELYQLELERIVLNMQISLMHSIARQARECIEKMTRAQVAYQRRLDQSTTLPLKESHP